MQWSKGKKNLTSENIFYYALLVNDKCDIALNKEEIRAISKSVYSYYQKNEIYISGEPKERDINEGAMKFEKIKGLSKVEYIVEVERRRRLSAQRTNDIVDIEKKKVNMREVQKAQTSYRKSNNQKKVDEAVREIKKTDKKLTVSEISRTCGLSRNTVRKYF